MARLGAENHNCSDCNLTKKIICNVDENDVKNYTTIMTGISTADVAINPSILEDDISEEKMKFFINMVMERKENFKKQEIEWWRNMIKRYNISNSTKIDVFNGQFYVCVDKNGNEKIDFEKKPENPDSTGNTIQFTS